MQGESQLTRMRWKSKGKALMTGMRKRGSKHAKQTCKKPRKDGSYRSENQENDRNQSKSRLREGGGGTGHGGQRRRLFFDAMARQRERDAGNKGRRTLSIKVKGVFFFSFSKAYNIMY